MKKTLLLLLLATPFVLFSQTAPVNSAQNNLREAFNGYLGAIKNRDITSLKTYLTKEKAISLIKGDGSLIKGNENYLQVQVDWFADTSWKYESEIVNIQEYDNTGIIIDKTKIYGETWEFHMMVTYVFRKEQMIWRLVTDICTPIESLNKK